MRALRAETTGGAALRSAGGRRESHRWHLLPTKAGEKPDCGNPAQASGWPARDNRAAPTNRLARKLPAEPPPGAAPSRRRYARPPHAGRPAQADSSPHGDPPAEHENTPRALQGLRVPARVARAAREPE